MLEAALRGELDVSAPSGLAASLGGLAEAQPTAESGAESGLKGLRGGASQLRQLPESPSEGAEEESDNAATAGSGLVGSPVREDVSLEELLEGDDELFSDEELQM